MSNTSEGKSGTKLKPTLDSIQKRFSCSTEELTIWRNCLSYRYSSIQDTCVVFEISDYDKNDAVLDNVPKLICMPLPSELAKSVIRIFWNSSKSITVTLYFTLQSGGTLLCQGKDCPVWDTDECEVLKAFVYKYMGDHNTDDLLKSLLLTPLSFISGLKESPPLSAPDTDWPTQTPSVTSPSCESPSAECQLLLAPDITDSSVKDCIIIYPPTPVVSYGDVQSTNNDSDESKHNVKDPSPVSKRTRNRRRGIKLYRSPVKHTCALNQFPVLKTKVEQLQTAIDSLESAHNNMEDFVTSLAEDAKTAAKNELRAHICDKFDSLNSEIQTLKASLTDLEKKNEQLKKENNSIKSQLGSLHSELKRLNSKQYENSSTQTTALQTLSDTIQIVSEQKAVQTSDSDSDFMNVSPENQQVNSDNDMPFFSKDMSFHATDNTEKSTVSPSKHECQVVDRNESEANVHYTVSVSNPFTVLSDSEIKQDINLQKVRIDGAAAVKLRTVKA